MLMPCKLKILYLALLFQLALMPLQATSQEWHRSTAVYQIYPRSFYDSSGDGIGDLEGIIQKLDYIKDLGFETIWISPFFSSPQKDFGYDISDFYSIAPEYGDMAACEKLIEEVHRRNMKIVFDLVMNHTSDQHAWFKESESSRDNFRADWYVWKDGKGKDEKKPPNNWYSMVGGSGWHYSEKRKQFYWAAFLPFQPDLNFRNPDVKKAMLDVVRFWLAKGVDGFRLDIFNAIYEDAELRDNPMMTQLFPSDENPGMLFQKAEYTVNQPESFEFATELRKVVDEFDNPKRFLIGEVFGDMALLKKFCEYNGKPGLNAVFLFKTLTMPFKAESYREMAESFEEYFPVPFIPSYVFSNHDRTRSFSRLGEKIEKSKLLAMFQFTVRGIPFTYYGEELGMKQSVIPLKEGKDPIAHRYAWIPRFIINMTGETLNRDESRTPMLWDDSENAGFCKPSVQPWLPISDNYKTTNVKVEQDDPISLLNFYKQVIGLRNESPALQSGRLEIADEFCSKKIFAYYRIHENEKWLMMLNMTGSAVGITEVNGELLLSTHAQPVSGELKAWEGRVIKLHH